jgi:hypothetical protein
MFDFLDRMFGSVIQFVTNRPMTLNREEWIYVFFLLVLFGYFCLRSVGQRGA